VPESFNKEKLNEVLVKALEIAEHILKVKYNQIGVKR
jgi:hypothetical protein